MANRLTKGQVLVGSLVSSAAGGGNVLYSQTGSVARTDTSAKNLFTLPANADIVGLRMYTATASDAGTTATVSIGKSGTSTAFLNAQDVKGAGTGVITTASKVTLGTIGTTAVVVQGIYAETGGASTTGGPFLLFVDYTLK